MTPTSPVAPRSPDAAPLRPEPTHPCARCGAPVGPGIGLCERCNPLGLRDVASSQVHGSVFIGIVAAVIGLAILAKLAISGLGPFPAEVQGIVASGDGLAVSVTVTNQGTALGQTTCRIVDAADRAISRSAFVVSPPLQPGQTLTFTTVVTEFGTEPRDLVVTCRTP